MNDVLIKYDELERLVGRLDRIIEEFEGARDRSGDIRDAVGMPFHRAELPDKAADAESRWSYKRGKLTESLISIRDYGQAIHEAYQEFDDEAASKFEEGAEPPSPPTVDGKAI